MKYNDFKTSYLDLDAFLLASIPTKSNDSKIQLIILSITDAEALIELLSKEVRILKEGKRPIQFRCLSLFKITI